MTRLGYAYRIDGSGRAVTGTTVPKGLKGTERLHFHVCAIRRLLEKVKPGVVVYEDYAMGVSKGNTFDIGELGGVLKYEIWRQKLNMVMVPPTCLKLFVTGKGNAKKEEVEQAIYAMSRRTFQTNDEADAYGLLLLGEYVLDKSRWTDDTTTPEMRAVIGCRII